MSSYDKWRSQSLKRNLIVLFKFNSEFDAVVSTVQIPSKLISSGLYYQTW